MRDRPLCQDRRADEPIGADPVLAYAFAHGCGMARAAQRRSIGGSDCARIPNCRSAITAWTGSTDSETASCSSSGVAWLVTGFEPVFKVSDVLLVRLSGSGKLDSEVCEIPTTTPTPSRTETRTSRSSSPEQRRMKQLVTEFCTCIVMTPTRWPRSVETGGNRRGQPTRRGLRQGEGLVADPDGNVIRFGSPLRHGDPMMAAAMELQTFPTGGAPTRRTMVLGRRDPAVARRTTMAPKDARF